MAERTPATDEETKAFVAGSANSSAESAAAFLAGLFSLKCAMSDDPFYKPNPPRAGAARREDVGCRGR